MAARFACQSPAELSSGRRDSAGQEAANDWSQHEHVADSVTTEAQRLVNLAGSIELAKQAVESAREPAPMAVKEAFADELGYGGLDELRAATMIVECHDGADWNITRTPAGRWVAWNESHVAVCAQFDTRDEAVAELRGTADGWRL